MAQILGLAGSIPVTQKLAGILDPVPVVAAAPATAVRESQPVGGGTTKGVAIAGTPAPEVATAETPALMMVTAETQAITKEPVGATSHPQY